MLDIVEIQSQTPNSIDLTKYTFKASSMRRFGAFDWPFHRWRIFFEDWHIAGVRWKGPAGEKCCAAAPGPRPEGPRRTFGPIITTMAAIGAMSGLRAVPLARTAASAKQPVRAQAVMPSAAAPREVRLASSAFLAPGAIGLTRRSVAPVASRSSRMVVKAEAASAAAVEAAEPAEKDMTQTLKVSLYIFGWYFLNAIFGEFHLLCSYRWSRIVAWRSSRALDNRPPRPRSHATLAPPRSVTDPSDEKSYSLSLLTMIF